MDTIFYHCLAHHAVTVAPTTSPAAHLVHWHVAALAEQDLVGCLAVALTTHSTQRIISVPAAARAAEKAAEKAAQPVEHVCK
jgi:hypothetical protein